MFQAMGKLLRDDPTSVTAEMSAWLSNQDSPALWAPFAFSIRGFAYEVMDEWELARSDYNEGLNLYDTLAEELGEETILRMINNVKFMRVRLGALPPPPVISPVESYFEMPSSEVKENIPVPDPVYEAIAAPNDETGAYGDAVGEGEVGGEGEWEAENFNEKGEEGAKEQFEEGQAEQYFEEGQVEEHFEEGQAEEHFEGQAEEHFEEGQVGEHVEKERGEEYAEGQAEQTEEQVQAEEQAEQAEEQAEQAEEQAEQAEEQAEQAEEQVEKQVQEQVEEQAEEQVERPEEQADEQAGETADQDQTFENWEDDVIDGQENENGSGEENEIGNGIETQVTQEDIENQEGEPGAENIGDESTVRGEKETLEEVPLDGTFATKALSPEADAGGPLNNEEQENADENQATEPLENSQ